MDMDSAAVFLAGTILYAAGILIILISIVTANNIIHKFWKSFGWRWTPNWFHEPPPQFMSQEEADKIAPTFEKK
jgi:hypothetical protein